MTTTADDLRPPDAVITASCEIDEGSFADVDSDGIDDLVLRSGPHVFSWPSTRGPGAPLVWTWSEAGEPGWVDLSTPNAGPARVQWWGHEYEVDPGTLALVHVGSGLEWAGEHHVGDVDGDGIADLEQDAVIPYFPTMSVRASSTGHYTAIANYDEYSAYYPWSVGDLNHDGYDDLIVGQRKWQTVELAPKAFESKTWGPAQLYLGSPTGIEPEPLWTLFAPGHPMAGVGPGGGGAAGRADGGGDGGHRRALLWRLLAGAARGDPGRGHAERVLRAAGGGPGARTRGVQAVRHGLDGRRDGTAGARDVRVQRVERGALAPMVGGRVGVPPEREWPGRAVDVVDAPREPGGGRVPLVPLVPGRSTPAGDPPQDLRRRGGVPVGRVGPSHRPARHPGRGDRGGVHLHRVRGRHVALGAP